MAAVPAHAGNQKFVWISSGTWSIMGVETDEPCLTEKALAYNFTNEGGVFDTWRLSKNNVGLWLVQECKRTWAHQADDLSYDEITRLAADAKPFMAVIDLDDARFLYPGDMPERIKKYCADTQQKVPETKGEIVRVALESLALKYRKVLQQVEELTGDHFEPIHIIGGGTKNKLLNQFTADCTGRVVVAGHVEATAIGNALMQANGLGHLRSLADLRCVVRASYAPTTYQPGNKDRWDEAYSNLQKVTR